MTVGAAVILGADLKLSTVAELCLSEGEHLLHSAAMAAKSLTFTMNK